MSELIPFHSLQVSGMLIEHYIYTVSLTTSLRRFPVLCVEQLIGCRHSEELSWTSRGWARDCKVLVCRRGTWSVNELRPVFHSLPGVFLFESGDGGWRSGGCKLGGLLSLRVSPLISQDV